MDLLFIKIILVIILIIGLKPSLLYSQSQHKNSHQKLIFSEWRFHLMMHFILIPVFI